VARAAPPGRSGLFHGVLILAFVQAFLYAIGFGAPLVPPREELSKTIAYGLLASVAAAPLLGVAATLLAYFLLLG
jgi:hypothetical protein